MDVNICKVISAKRTYSAKYTLYSGELNRASSVGSQRSSLFTVAFPFACVVKETCRFKVASDRKEVFIDNGELEAVLSEAYRRLASCLASNLSLK